MTRTNGRATRATGTSYNLVLPPGDPRSWTITYVIRRDDSDGVAVAVQMWTRELGRSDLILEVELDVQPDGRLSARFHNLHVCRTRVPRVASGRSFQRRQCPRLDREVHLAVFA